MRISLLSIFLLACGGGATTTPMPDLAPAPDQAQATTWTNTAQAFFQSYCNSCHKPGGQAATQDFSMYPVVMANSVAIRCGVSPAGQKQSGCGNDPAPGQFPIGTGPKPSDAERLAIVAWIDAGMPN